MDTADIEASFDEQSKIEAVFKQRMRRAITVTIILMTIMYLVVVIPLMAIGTTQISMHIVGFVAMILVFPILTFFAGMWLVWKKKFFPEVAEEEE